MPAPLPLIDLLELLRERKMEIGVREHLTIGLLLSRWGNTDVDTFRDAIAAVLARNQEEVATVRIAFDELYRPPVEEPNSSSPLPEGKPEQRSPRWLVLAIAATFALCLILGALYWPGAEPQGPQPIATPGPSPQASKLSPDRDRVLAGAAGIGGCVFLGLYRLRLRRAAERAARRRWHEALEELPEPHGYEIKLKGAAAPFPPAALEEAAALLERRAPTIPHHNDLDIDRTLQHTLRAGLAPHLVFRTHSAAPSLVVLEDIGSEMAPWRGRVSALLSGLAARGAPLDHWQFHTDASRVFRALGESEISLRQLARMRATSPLLVLSVGAGVLQGWEGRLAPWIEQLAAWPHRAWLNPVGDPGSWPPVLHRPDELKISLWPMTPEGLLAATRHLAHGQPGTARATLHSAADRPVAPLDVDRLRWLLALTPRRDPELLERLRQEFCPYVPQAALFEALVAPPLTTPLELPPAAEAVQAFLADLLAASEPEPGTGAHERWRFDRALQEIRVSERQTQALVELQDLARGPLAGQVGDAVEEIAARAGRGPGSPLPGPLVRELRKTVLGPIRHHAAKSRLGGWRRVPPPSWWASTAALLAALLAIPVLPAVTPWFNREDSREEPVHQETRYRLRLIDEMGDGPFRFEVDGDARWRDVPKVLVGGEKRKLAEWPDSLDLPDSARGSSYYVRDVEPDKDGILGISNNVSVGRREVTSTTPIPLYPSPDLRPVDPEPITDKPAPSDDLITPGPGVEYPEPITVIAAPYPAAALGRRLTTRVRIAVLIDKNGNVIQTRIREGDTSGLGFNEAALEAARRVHFLPATRNGVPGQFWTELVYEFEPPMGTP